MQEILPKCCFTTVGTKPIPWLLVNGQIVGHMTHVFFQEGITTLPVEGWKFRFKFRGSEQSLNSHWTLTNIIFTRWQLQIRALCDVIDWWRMLVQGCARQESSCLCAEFCPISCGVQKIKVCEHVWPLTCSSFQSLSFLERKHVFSIGFPTGLA